MTRLLYRTPVPESALRETDRAAQAELAKLGLIGAGKGSTVDSIATNPGEVGLRAQYRGRYADRLGLELSELLDAGDLQNLPFTKDGDHTELDGYFAVESAHLQRTNPETEKLMEVRGRLVREGTRASHRRAVKTRVTQPDPGNTFGNETTAYIGVPASASHVQWIDDVPASQTASATVAATRTARFGDVDVVDARAPSFADPILVYDLAYSSQGDVDVKVWDTYDATSPTDGDGIVQWGRVYDPQHDPRVNDELVVENGIVRLWFDDADHRLVAEEWDDANTTWASLSLGTSDWELLETDVRIINGARVEANVTFRDSTNTSSQYDLDMVLTRGDDLPKWLVPEGKTDSLPLGLSDLLDPIADEQVYTANPEYGLVARSDF